MFFVEQRAKKKLLKLGSMPKKYHAGTRPRREAKPALIPSVRL